MLYMFLKSPVLMTLVFCENNSILRFINNYSHKGGYSYFVDDVNDLIDKKYFGTLPNEMKFIFI